MKKPMTRLKSVAVAALTMGLTLGAWAADNWEQGEPVRYSDDGGECWTYVTSLGEAVTCLQTCGGIVELNGDVNFLSDTQALTTESDLVVRTWSGHKGVCTLTRTSSDAGKTWSIANGGKLTFENIALNAGANAIAGMFQVASGGALYLNEGASLTSQATGGNNFPVNLKGALHIGGGVIRDWTTGDSPIIYPTDANAQVFITAGGVTNCTQTASGAAVVLGGNAYSGTGTILTMSGGFIKDNKQTGAASKSGGVICFYNSTPTVVLTGGEISGNTSTYGYCGAICRANLRVSGRPVVENNTSAGVVKNIYHSSDATKSCVITQTDDLDDDKAYLGVYSDSLYEYYDEFAAIVGGYSTMGSEAFVNDRDTMLIGSNGGDQIRWEDRYVEYVELTIPAKTGLNKPTVTSSFGTVEEASEGVWSVAGGSKVTVTFTAETGYRIVSGNPVVVKMDDYEGRTLEESELPEVVLIPISTITVAPVTGASTVTVYTNGTVEVTGVEGVYTVESNAAATVTYTADAGYAFPGGATTWTTNFTASAAAITVTIPEGEKPTVKPVKYLEPVYKTIGGVTSVTNGIDHWLTNSVSTFTVVESDTTTWNTGWYVVSEDVTINDSVTCQGDVKLILADGATLTVNGGSAGIQTDADGSFTVYGQENGTGALNVTSSDSDCAAIGGGYEGAGSNITINGGTVTATVDDYGSSAAIGGGSEGAGSNITINGGTVNATVGEGASGAAIGGGYEGAGSNITINGGTVNATVGEYANGAAIGGGYEGAGSDITINGGTVNATCGEGAQGAGIGGGYCAAGSGITINGGEVTATCGAYSSSAGIGGGGGSESSSRVTINGGTVTATGSMGIGDPNNTADITVNGGTVTAICCEDGIAGIGAWGKLFFTVNGGEVTANGGNAYGSIYVNDGGSITVNGGTVTATGGENGDGIYNSSSTVTVNGGTLTATGGDGYCGIDTWLGHVYMADGVLVKADNSNPPTTVIEHASITTDIAGALNEKRYMTAGLLRAVAVKSTDEKTLTFYYNTADHASEGTVYVVPESAAEEAQDIPWCVDDNPITNVVFDASFADYQPQSTAFWFYRFQALTGITSIQNLNTSSVTSMVRMFNFCSALIALDVRGFDTANVTSMGNMFSGCSNLKTIYASDAFKTDQVTSSDNMFKNCTLLVGGKGTTFDENVVDKTYARIDGGTAAPGYFTEPDYLTFTAVEDNSTVEFTWKSGTDVMINANGTWETYTAGTTITLADVDDKVMFKGKGVKTDWQNHFGMTGKIAASGDVGTLTDGIGGEDVALTDDCYSCMFMGCWALTAAPTLPATNLAAGCYANMFDYCTSLTAAPELPATVLAERCYSQMFYGCKALTAVPALPAMTLAARCYYMMFGDCTALTAVPALPATTLAEECYSYMFAYCTSLVVNNDAPGAAWSIPSGVTTAQNWNSYMFYDTAGTFTGAPEVGATYYVGATKEVVGDATLYRYGDEVGVSVAGELTKAIADALKDKAITNLIVGSGVTKIGASAFDGWRTLKDVTIGANCTNIGAQAFLECWRLTNVTCAASSAITIGDYAFYRCNSLEAINLSANPKLGEKAFTMQAAIYMKDGVPVVYAIPQITIEGYVQVLKGTNDLSDPESWVTVDDETKGNYHFFKVVLEEVK